MCIDICFNEIAQMMKITVRLRNTKFIQTQIPAANRGLTPIQLFAELLEGAGS